MIKSQKDFHIFFKEIIDSGSSISLSHIWPLITKFKILMIEVLEKFGSFLFCMWSLIKSTPSKPIGQEWTLDTGNTESVYYPNFCNGGNFSHNPFHFFMFPMLHMQYTYSIIIWWGWRQCNLTEDFRSMSKVSIQLFRFLI